MNARLDVTLVNISQAVPTRDDVEIMLDEELVWAGGKMRHGLSPRSSAAFDLGRGVHGALMRYRRWKRAGRPYRVAYVSSHSTGQRAAILADLAIAPFSKTLWGGYRRSGA